MSWFKKTLHKISKSLRRAAKGRFHASTFHKGLLDPVTQKLISKNDKLKTWTSYGRSSQKLGIRKLRKSHKLGLKHLKAGNNSAQSYQVVQTSPYLGTSYRYKGRRLGDMI